MSSWIQELESGVFEVVSNSVAFAALRTCSEQASTPVAECDSEPKNGDEETDSSTRVQAGMILLPVAIMSSPSLFW